MDDIISYAKDAQEAFKNYVNSGDIDLDLCHKIYDDISRIELLDTKSREELDSFINNNTIDEIPLSVGLESDEYSKYIRRMLPVKLSKHNKHIYRAEGNFYSVVADEPSPITVKVKRKTYAKKSA